MFKVGREAKSDVSPDKPLSHTLPGPAVTTAGTTCTPGAAHPGCTPSRARREGAPVPSGQPERSGGRQPVLPSHSATPPLRGVWPSGLMAHKHLACLRHVASRLRHVASRSSAPRTASPTSPPSTPRGVTQPVTPPVTLGLHPPRLSLRLGHLTSPTPPTLLVPRPVGGVGEVRCRGCLGGAGEGRGRVFVRSQVGLVRWSGSDREEVAGWGAWSGGLAGWGAAD